MLRLVTNLNRTSSVGFQLIRSYGARVINNDPIPLPNRPPNYKDFELTKFVESKTEFEFVEKILPNPVVPDAPKEGVFPSGWRAPNYELGKNLPYFVERNRFHNYPVYKVEREGGSRKLIRIKKINGDIWKFDQDLRDFVRECIKKNEGKDLPVYSQVNEVQRHVLVKGLYQDYINEFLIKCGF